MHQDLATLLDCLMDKSIGVWKVFDEVCLVHVWHRNDLVDEFSGEPGGGDVSDLEDVGDVLFFEVLT